jgi:diaminopimelate decarboxylase
MTHQQLLQIANTYGTPTYAYDTNIIANQYKKLTEAFAVINTKFFYACKALTNINILRYINSLGCNIDCSSINEVKLAIHAGVPLQKILYTSNGIAFSEIEEAVSLGVHVNIDSISNLTKFAKQYGNTYAVGVRIRPNILAGGNLKISTGHEKSKFGIGIDQVDKIVQLVNYYN